MSIPQSAGGPIGSRDELVRYLEAGNKPKTDWRIGTEHEKFVYDPKTFKPVLYEGKPGIRALLEGMQRFGWEPVIEGDNIIGLTPERRLDQPGAGRPVRTVRRRAQLRPRDLHRGEHPSERRCARWPAEIGAGGDRARLCAELGPRRGPADAQGPLQHHAPLHAQGRRLWAGDDVPHLHGAGESRFLQRSRHGQEIPRRPGAAAGGHRAVRQFAVPRRPAQRLPVLSQPDLDRCRQCALGHAALGVRGRHGLRALCRLRARCADVFRLSRRQIYRRRRQELPRFSGRQRSGTEGHRAARCPTGPII